MRRKWIFIIPAALAGMALLAFARRRGRAQLLWNWLLPPLFGWRQIAFWQALGLLALCRIFFGGLGGHGPHRSGFRRRRAESCGQMTPEEREKLRQRLHDRWGAAPADSQPGA